MKGGNNNAASANGIHFTGNDAMQVLDMLMPLLWFLAGIAFLYVAALVIKSVAPEGLIKVKKKESKEDATKDRSS